MTAKPQTIDEYLAPLSNEKRAALFGVGFIAYGFIVRKRYYSYLEAERLARY